MNQPELILTGDGSHTLKLDGANEHYHSIYGALAESRHVFINAGLRVLLERKGEHINVLDVGLGTGLNALLSMIEAHHDQHLVHYTALELHPLDEQCWKQLNYPALVDDPRAREWFLAIHRTAWNARIPLSEFFTMVKLHIDLLEFNAPKGHFDLVYFDAFSPDIQPELWTEIVFARLYGAMKSGGLILTYSAKGNVRRAMQAAGFVVERLPGPEGKREMLRARHP